MHTNDLLELIEKRSDVTLHIKGGELLELANHLIETTKKQLEQIIRGSGYAISDYWVKSEFSRYKVYFLH